MNEPTKLVGSGRNGDFVHANQDMAKTEGFANVSKLWFDKTISYDQGLEQIENDKQYRKDVLASTKEMILVPESDGIIMMIAEQPFKLNQYALQQLGNRWEVGTTIVNMLSTPKLKPNSNGVVKYSRDLGDMQTLVNVLNNGKRRIESDKRWFIRTHKDTIRAIMTEDYTPINNSWYVEIIKELIPGGRLSHWRGDSDTIYGNVLIPDTIRQEDDSDYGGMISLGNCEIGKRAFEQFPSLFRAICMNGCIWDQAVGSKVRKIHRGEIKLGELRNIVKDNINKQIPLVDDIVKRFMSLRDKRFGLIPTKNVFYQFAMDYKLTKKEFELVGTEFVKNEAGEKNAFGLINAVTRAGQKLSNEQWLNFDAIGGEMLNYSTSKWDRFLGQAKDLTAEEMEAVYA